MPQNVLECSVCGNTDYSVRDGLYYCTLCQTQSQNVVEYDFSEMVEGAQTRPHAIREKKLKTETKKREKLEKQEIILPPYALHEAYAIILHRLGDSLIQLGLPPTVKEALFRLYALYLRRRGIAFLETNINETIHTASKDDLAAILPRGASSYKRKPAKLLPKSAIKLELDDYLASQAAATDYDVFADFFGGPSTAASEPEPTPEPPPTPATPSRKRRHSVASTVTISDDEDDSEEEMDDNKINNYGKIQPAWLIPFCYLACVAVCPQKVFISDLIRWGKENLLPVVDAEKLLPKRLDHPLIRAHFGFHSKAFNNELIRELVLEHSSKAYRRALWLSNYIGYPADITFDVDQMLAKYAYELNLTKYILPRARAVYRAAKVTHNVFHFKPTDNLVLQLRTSPATPPEVAAIAILIVALKLTFGLDDICEQLISQAADHSNGHLNSDSQFSFSRWLLQCKLRSAVLEGESVQRVLSRSWIDERDTWMYSLVKQLESSQGRGGHANLGVTPTTQDDEEPESTRGRKEDDINVKELRKLFDEYTPFKTSSDSDPVANRLYLNPMRDTVQLWEQIKKKGWLKESDVDPNNVEVFCHEFFHDSLSFLENSSLRKKLNKAMKEVTGINAEGKSKITEMLPCVKFVSLLGNRQLADSRWYCNNFRVLRMMDKEDEYEISSTMKWLLNFCTNFMHEDLWVMFRAIQLIERSLGKDLLESARYPRNFVTAVLDIDPNSL